jgi:phospholipase/carboxylesterase
MSTLAYVERPAAGPGDGVLFLQHGRGADEQDLIGLADVVDPERRLHVVSPRAPLSAPGLPGYHWYAVDRPGHPDLRSFMAGRDQLAAFHDETWVRTGLGPERTVIGGFSMGCAMSYATGLDAERPRPGGILGLSGFIPRVDGWEPALAERVGMPVLIAHGRRHPVRDVALGREAAERLHAGGLTVEYLEFGGEHTIDMTQLGRFAAWLREVLPPSA